MKKFIASILLLPLLASAPLPRETYPEVLADYEVTGVEESVLQEISEKFEIHSRRQSASGEDVFGVYVPEEQQEVFLELAPTARLIEGNTHSTLLNSIRDLSGYRGIDEVYARLQELDQNYDFVQLLKYGESTQGRPLYALKISDNPEIDDNEEPDLMFTSTTHGDELITAEVTLRYFEELIESYDSSQAVKDLVDSREIYYIPVVNPDGFSRRSRYANGVDPNRQYPWPENEERESVACIKHLIEFFHSKDFEGTLDVHAYGRLVMYPWAWTKDFVEDSVLQEMQELGKSMALKNNYRVGPISHVIYVAKGSSADYYHWKNGSLAMAIELSRAKVLPSEKIPEALDEAREMFTAFLNHF